MTLMSHNLSHFSFKRNYTQHGKEINKNKDKYFVTYSII